MRHFYNSIPCCLDEDFAPDTCVFSVPKGTEIRFAIQYIEPLDDTGSYYLTVYDLDNSYIGDYLLELADQVPVLVSKPFALPNEIDAFMFEIMFKSIK